ncbi:Protein of unknown function [Roseivivax lentus]|uniref:UDP-N-acetylmuramate--alanine ligase n=1 Tax=Roseivivax lentus TaxID=633194 RepID=A0A1N7L3J1_9RHOB|nr:DUF2484 family protein [Roseivivax lentus]SIS68240.1 Protein of unknown function [Roseivivax lentus]
MAPALLTGCVWVIAATITACLPMKHQYIPGIALLIAAPLLLIWIGFSIGPLWAVAGLAAFLSMFRNPLKYFWARLRGRKPEVPE